MKEKVESSEYETESPMGSLHWRHGMQTAKDYVVT